jgi:LacI family transcriptional regulator
MRDVAALAGVSLKTVSRVVNHESGVSPELVADVERAAAQLDYRHNLAASNLRRGVRTASVGALLQDLSNSFSATLLRAVEDEARPRGVAVLSASVDEDPERERELTRDLLSRQVDGLILTPVGADLSYLQPDIRTGVGVVAVDRPAHGIDVDTVVTDNVGGARRAVEHLLSAGHERIACLTDASAIWTAQERRRGFLDAAARHGVDDPGLVVGDVTGAAAAADVVHALMRLASPPTAIFAGQNAITIGAVHALRALGLQERVALVGFDDFPLADLVLPPVTVVRQDVPALGQRVARLLFARLDGDSDLAERHVLPAELVPRGSGEIRPA